MKKPVPVRGLEIKHPYAMAVAMGEKTVELKSTYTPFRGVVIIRAAREFDRRFVRQFTTAVGEPDLAERCSHTAGHVIGIAWLDDCRPARKSDEASALMKVPPEYYAWVLKGAVEFQGTMPFKSGEGLFKISPQDQSIFKKVGYWIMIESLNNDYNLEAKDTWED